MSEEILDEGARILKAQRNRAKAELRRSQDVLAAANAAVEATQEMIRSLSGTPASDTASTTQRLIVPPPLRSWAEILSDAESAGDRDELLLEPDERLIVDERVKSWCTDFSNVHRLDRCDYVVATIAGVLAGIADIVLVQMPAHLGRLGGVAPSGGPLPNALKAFLNDALPDETVHRLERVYTVPFDAPNNARALNYVAGLNWHTHRVLSPGHDPVLGWLAGTLNVMTGTMTTISAAGTPLTQKAMGFGPNLPGETIFVRLWDALTMVAGHMVSDVPTSTGLPPPFFCLLQLIQAGHFRSPRGKVVDVAELVRAMYANGYDFRFFVAGSVSPAIIEVLVRTAWVIRQICDGAELHEIVPVGKPRLNSTLFLAHSIAVGINAGKVACTNVMGLNYAQWLTWSHYLCNQTMWLAINREHKRKRFVRTRLDAHWSDIDLELQNLWTRCFGDSTDPLAT